MENIRTTEESGASAEAKPGLLKIRIGVAVHLVDTDKIPYFKSFANFQRASGQAGVKADAPVPAAGAASTAAKDDAPLSHSGIPFFDAIVAGTEEGLRYCFRRMRSTDLADCHTLCEQLDFLGVDVLGPRKLRDISKDLSAGRSGFDKHGRHIRGNKSLARDSAFRLVYAFLVSEFESDVRDATTAYHATAFVVSHPDIFRYRTRKIVRDAFEERFRVSNKQRLALDKWPIDKHPDPQNQKDSSTKEEARAWNGPDYDSWSD